MAGFGSLAPGQDTENDLLSNPQWGVMAEGFLDARRNALHFGDPALPPWDQRIG